jgi:hypothetical protein
MIGFFFIIQPYKQESVDLIKNLKLNPKYYRPYQISKKMRAIAYQLRLSKGNLIHLVFHVSLLKK